MPAKERHPATREAEEIAAFLVRHGVGEGARILDVPCGIGRRAFALAERGYRVVAVDANEVGVEAAGRRVPASLRDRVRFAAAPRETWPARPADDRFDAILCLDHALGRDSEAADVAFLGRLGRHVAPDGLVLVDLYQRDFFALRPRPFAFHVVGAMEQHEFRAFDAATDVLQLSWTFYERQGEDLRHRADSSVRLRLFTAREACGLLEAAGWRVEGLTGGWREGPPKPEHRNLVLAARVK